MTYTADAMKLKINGEERETSATTIAELLAVMELQGQPVAVEVNRRLVPKRDHMTATLNEGDTIELVTLVGGG